ncbi:MAG TPA: hypothetical protein VGE59_03775 [Patescibacteria group bacterium]
MKALVKFAPAIALAAYGVFATATPVFAQSANDLFGLQLSVYNGNFQDALIGIINFILLAGGVLAFIFVLWGGFTYLSAGGDAAAAGKGRTMIVNAVIGLIIIFLSFSLVRFLTSRFDDNAGNSTFQDDDIK